MELTSSAFADQATIPDKYTCRGANLSPPLSIKGIPEGAKSLFLIVHDPDAVGGDWVHWLVWNIAPNSETISEGVVSTGAVEGQTSFGKPGYGGPCPPPGTGTHRYIFELYALDNNLTIVGTADRTKVEAAMESHIISHTTLTGLVAAQ